MVFSSPTFLFLFLPIVWLLHLIAPRRWRNLLLLLASLVFYGWGEPVFVLVMLLSCLVNYGLARGLSADHVTAEAQKRKAVLVLAIIFNIGLLAVFKYADFLVYSLNNLFSLAIPQPGIPLPIGISFFTFQALSYVIDVYRQETPVQKRLDSLMLYIAFFPQLIAGPIVKYHDIADQIDARTITVQKTSEGIRRFIVGLGKKLLLANTFGRVADQVFSLLPAELSFAVSWLGAFCYLLQIYFDFSGYSDVAIGLGHVFGFSFKENFRYPYQAENMQDFWRRWHISLSTWFREYLYIPLGGNRNGQWRTGINRVIVFFITGLWHGAGWTFIIWGLYHGFFLLLESYRLIRTDWLWRPLRHVYTILVVLVGFVLFRSEHLVQAGAFLRSMFLSFAASGDTAARLLQEAATPGFLILLPVAFVLTLPIGPWLHRRLAHARLPQPLLDGCSLLLALLVLYLCLLSLSAADYNPFIYFRF
ncbi:MAG: MBOAT family protein [Clostridiaceae bacterium]|nr:MBOAT family protein [Clostridiaceae bacterium]